MDKQTKINNLLSEIPQGVALQSFWLADHGYSASLQQRYRKSNWLEAIGAGAMMRAGQKIGYQGGVYALQVQSGLSVHPGGRTALSLLGKTHYLELFEKKATLFGSKEEKLPTWFRNYNWGIGIDYHAASFLPPGIGMIEIEQKDFAIKVSDAPRAVMECLYLASDTSSLTECYQLMEAINNVRPDQVQALLTACKSVRVKRLFLYLAEKAKHEWFHYLDLTTIDVGQGKRSMVKGGVYIPKYKITVPKELENQDGEGSL